jgi:hypothetical protein
MKHIILTIALLFSLQIFAECGEAGKFAIHLELDPKTNLPFTGNIEVINNDWNGAVEFSKDFVDGLMHGEEKVFYQSGTLKSIGHWSKGIINGLTEVYYEDGSLMIRINFIDGLREGKAVRYYSNGQLAVESYYKDDLLEGASTVWYESGKLMEQAVFNKGLKFSFQRYKEDGSPYFDQKTIYNSNTGSLG